MMLRFDEFVSLNSWWPVSGSDLILQCLMMSWGMDASMASYTNPFKDWNGSSFSSPSFHPRALLLHYIPTLFISPDKANTHYLRFQRESTLRHNLSSRPEFAKMPYPGRGCYWHVVDNDVPTAMSSREVTEAPVPPISQDITRTLSPQLPVPIHRAPFDSSGKPMAVWAPVPRHNWRFPSLVDSPTLRGRFSPFPSQEIQTLYAPLPESTPNLSANADMTSDDGRNVCARDKGKGKAREMHEEEDGSINRPWTVD